LTEIQEEEKIPRGERKGKNLRKIGESLFGMRERGGIERSS